MFLFEKKIIRQFFISYVHVDFQKYSKLKNMRREYDKCEMCEKSFESNDMTHLAYVTNDENLLICDKCKDRVLANGAEETTYNKR